MKKIFLLLLLMLPAISVFAEESAAVTKTAGPALFPAIVLQSLEDKYLSFPYEVTSKARVSHIIVTFKRPDDKDMETWVRPFMEKFKGNTGAAHYSFALVGDVGLINGFIFNGMRDSATPEMRSSLLVYFHDKEPYKKLFNVTDDSLIYNYIVDQNGIIRLAIAGKSAGKDDTEMLLKTAEALLKPHVKSVKNKKKPVNK